MTNPNLTTEEPIMTFNEFLVSDEGRRVLNSKQADLLAANLARHSVTIRRDWDLCDFMDAHPEYFCDITDEEKRAGAQTAYMMWVEYERYNAAKNRSMQRNLGGQRARPRGERLARG
jgi:hypothetical protein